MSEFDRDLESMLAAELRRRSGDVLPTERLADRARSRARAFRRRRRVAIGTVTAATLAVAIPAALSLQGAPQTAPLPASTPEVSASPTPKPRPTQTSERPSTTPPASTTPPPTPGGSTTLSVDNLPAGAPPSIGWREGATFHRSDGGQVQMPDMMADPLEHGDSVVGSVLRFNGPPIVTFVAANGDVTASHPGYGPVISPDRSLVAAYDQQESVLRATKTGSGGTGPDVIDVPDDQQLEPVGFLDDRTVVSNISIDNDDAGIRLDRFPTGGAEAASVTPPWKLTAASAVSSAAQLVAGYTEITDSGSCSAVYEANAAEPLWSTCEYSFDHFSPDGRYLVGADDYRDGAGEGIVVVADARTGEVIHTYTIGDVEGTAFEDNAHVLVSVRVPDGSDRLAALLRCDLAGACELATPVLRVSESDWAYGLGQQP